MLFKIITFGLIIAIALFLTLFFVGLFTFNEKFAAGCAVVVILAVGFMIFLNHQNVETSITTEMTITHMDIVQNKSNTHYKISVVSDDKSVSDVISVTKQEYAIYNIGDTIPVIIESGKTYGGQEFIRVKPR